MGLKWLHQTDDIFLLGNVHSNDVFILQHIGTRNPPVSWNRQNKIYSVGELVAKIIWNLKEIHHQILGDPTRPKWGIIELYPGGCWTGSLQIMIQTSRKLHMLMGSKS